MAEAALNDRIATEQRAQEAALAREQAERTLAATAQALIAQEQREQQALMQKQAAQAEAAEAARAREAAHLDAVARRFGAPLRHANLERLTADLDSVAAANAERPVVSES